MDTTLLFSVAVYANLRGPRDLRARSGCRAPLVFFGVLRALASRGSLGSWLVRPVRFRVGI